MYLCHFTRAVCAAFRWGALGVDMWAGEILLDMQRQVEYRELML